MTTKNTGQTLYGNKEHRTDSVWQQRTRDRHCMTTKNTGQTVYDNKEHGRGNKEHGTDTVWQQRTWERQQRTRDRQCMTTKNMGEATKNTGQTAVAPLSVRMWMIRVTSVSAPRGQFSTSSSSSGEFIPIPFTWTSTRPAVTSQQSHLMRRQLRLGHIQRGTIVCGTGRSMQPVLATSP